MQPLSQIIDPQWAAALEPVEPDIRRMGEFLRGELEAGREYLPAGKNVLRAFTYPLDAVKVLIVGQDPYPTKGHPVGLSFSADPHVQPFPRSLVNIFHEMHDDVGTPMPTSPDLTPWCDRGVMLLNRVLTVEPGKSGSHRGKGWEKITEYAIRQLAARDKPLVAILWGRPAQELQPLLGNTPAVMSPHPSPLSASRGFFRSRPFSKANQLLEQQGAKPIDWELP